MSTLLRRRNLLPKQLTVAFNPLTQVTPLHAVWAGDSSWLHPADGGAVSSWRNQSGGGDPAQATGGAQPLYRASVSQLGNRPAVEFDGTDDCLITTVTSQSAPFKAIVVARLVAAVNSRNIVNWYAGTSNGIGQLGSTAVWGISDSTNLLSSTTTDTAGHVFRGTFASGASQLWLDGTSIVGPGSAGANALTGIKIGCGGATTTNSRFANTQISFIGLYSNATSDTDLAQLASDLKTHYGL